MVTECFGYDDLHFHFRIVSTHYVGMYVHLHLRACTPILFIYSFIHSFIHFSLFIYLLIYLFRRTTISMMTAVAILVEVIMYEHEK